MKPSSSLLVASAIALSSVLSAPVLAQAAADQNGMEMAGNTAPGMSEGEVRKVAKAAGKLTIKHGEIKHMDMPGMTMVFVVKDTSMLDKINAGDKISFMVIKENGKLTVTDIQPAQ